jgi:hypothetical protein
VKVSVAGFVPRPRVIADPPPAGRAKDDARSCRRYMAGINGASSNSTFTVAELGNASTVLPFDRE